MQASEVPRATAALLPPSPGVYRFRDANGRVLYVGRAVNLRRRVQSYWGDLGDRRHLRRMVPQIVRVEALPCDSPHEAAWLERNLLQRSKPRWNRARGGGAEKEVWIRLDDSARTPGLFVVHHQTPGRCFGPYLGGQKVRDAVAALGRVLPLAYTADLAAGSTRDMARLRGTGPEQRVELVARLRGTGPEQRVELVARLTAVLDREVTAVQAVRAGILARRDAAAGALGFELAGRLQAELVGLDWVCGTQRVTRPGAGDLDAYGFADGLLVSLGIRDGRRCTWQARPASAATGLRRAQQTPPQWGAFASRAAELAARLASPFEPLIRPALS